MNALTRYFKAIAIGFTMFIFSFVTPNSILNIYDSYEKAKDNEINDNIDARN